MKIWKLLLNRVPLKGSLNMAIDDYLFHSLGESPQTYLRFYQWEKPTVSLGYSQAIARVVNLHFCKANGIDIVRRITGGKLVLHHQEITYSLCSSDTRVFTSTLAESYRLISEALILGLKKMGLNPSLARSAPAPYIKGNLPCFSFPAACEIEVEGKKIVGSAQKREGKRFLQHGSLPLKANRELLGSVSLQLGKVFPLHMISLSEALQKDISFEEAVSYLLAGFSEYFSVPFKEIAIDTREEEAISKIQKERYESIAWTFWK